MYLDYAEDQAQHRCSITMKDWEGKLDAFLTFNERDILNHSGKISSQVAEQLVIKHYKEFDFKRKKTEQLTADKEDIIELEKLELLKKLNFNNLQKNCFKFKDLFGN